jgi:hypothetical protein
MEDVVVVAERDGLQQHTQNAADLGVREVFFPLANDLAPHKH